MPNRAISPCSYACKTIRVKKSIRDHKKADLMLKDMVIIHLIFSTFLTGHFDIDYARVADQLSVEISLALSELMSYILQVLRASVGRSPISR